MQWKGRRQSDNIEDMRGSSGGFSGGGMRFPGGGFPGGGRRGGGLSIGTLIILGLVLWFLGLNPLVPIDNSTVRRTRQRKVENLSRGGLLQQQQRR